MPSGGSGAVQSRFRDKPIVLQKSRRKHQKQEINTLQSQIALRISVSSSLEIYIIYTLENSW